MDMVDQKAFNKFFKDVQSGKEKKPKWMKDRENDCFDDNSSTTLEIIPKDPKFAKLAKLAMEFLNSIETGEDYG
jgi:hypothetical protein